MGIPTWARNLGFTSTSITRLSKRRRVGSQRHAMHWQARSGIGGDRGADRGILAARVQGVEPAGERCEHVSRRNESAREPCTCAVEVDWGADPMRGSGGYLIILITTP